MRLLPGGTPRLPDALAGSRPVGRRTPEAPSPARKLPSCLPLQVTPLPPIPGPFSCVGTSPHFRGPAAASEQPALSAA